MHESGARNDYEPIGRGDDRPILAEAAVTDGRVGEGRDRSEQEVEDDVVAVMEWARHAAVSSEVGRLHADLFLSQTERWCEQPEQEIIREWLTKQIRRRSS